MKRLMKTALIASVAIAGQLYAQPASAPGGSPPPAPPADPSAPVVVAPKKPLSAEQMKARGLELVEQVHTDGQHVQYLQTVARREKDVIKLSCVNDKYVRLKAESNVFDKSYASLLATLDSGDRETNFRAVVDASVSTHKIREEADGCIGAVEIGGEQPKSSFTAPDIVDDPTTGLPFDDNYGGATVEPPGYASPYS